jgi:glycosyltransferase involved in cell wall biosynthesis
MTDAGGGDPASGARILVVSNLFPPAVHGGYEVECATVVEHLRSRHRVLVLTSTKGKGEAEADVLRRLPFIGPSRARSLLAPVDALRAARTARRALATFGPDLVYIWNGSAIPQAALRVLETSGVPVAYRICEHWFGRIYGDDRFMRHLEPGERGLRGLWARSMRLLNRLPGLRLDTSRPVPVAVCWNSDALRRLSGMPGTVDVRLERIVHPATRQGEAFAGINRAPAPEPLIACIGRIDEYKGTRVAYEALAALRANHGIPARMAVAGSGDARFLAVLRRLAARLDIAGAVEERGQLGVEGLVELLGEAHAVVVPSVWEEPAGLVCVEAALARVPVVASRVGGIPEILRDGRDALLFPPGDAGACADALARTLRDRDATAARVESAYHAVQAFRLPAYLERMDEFLAAARADLPARSAS